MSGQAARRGCAFLLFAPFKLLWRLVTWFEKLIGIALCLILGLAFMAVGLFLIFTFIGAIIGIPLFILGFLLLIRGLF